MKQMTIRGEKNNKMKSIICPYCCNRFSPDEMVFRLKRMPEWSDLRENPEDGIYMLDDPDFGYTDQKLIDYFVHIEKRSIMDAKDMAREISPFGCLTILHPENMRGSDLDYDQNFMEEHGFVRTLTYREDFLDQRVCPHCHNDVVDLAGLYDMKMISLYGGANSGKTTYLNILQAVLEGIPEIFGGNQNAFEGQMVPLGSKETIESQKIRYKKLLEEGILPEATTMEATFVPHIFHYSYKTAENPENVRNLILIFRDISGEDCLNTDYLRRYGFYLKASDGIMITIDSSLLQGVMNFSEERMASAYYHMDSVNNLRRLVSTVCGEKKMEIPAAVVLTKCDALKRVVSLSADDSFDKIIQSENAERKHDRFVDKRAIQELNQGIQDRLYKMGESRLVNTVERCFEHYSYFAVSALGYEVQKSEEYRDEWVQRVKNIRPYRVTEPFYWLLAKNDDIPYLFYERYSNGEEVREVGTLYFESERSGIARIRHYENLKRKGILRKNFWGKESTGKWKLIFRSNDF